jgi:hypothetical protein
MSIREIVLKSSPDPTTINASETLQKFVLKNDGAKVQVNHVVLVDPVTGKALTFPIDTNIVDPATQTYQANVGPLASLQAQSANGVLSNAVQYLLNPSTTFLEPKRTPTIFKYATDLTTDGATVWTPAAGKKFRVLGFTVTVSKDATCAGSFSFQLNDLATGFWAATLSHGALAAIGVPTVFTVNLPGNGYLSTAINQALKLGLGAVLTAGSISVAAWGTEE